MIYITQLIYLKENQEKIFEEFEKIAIPIISKYNGKLMLRIRPESSSIVASTMEKPYEVHVVSFENENDLERFFADEERKKYTHLKDQSVKQSFLIKGYKL